MTIDVSLLADWIIIFGAAIIVGRKFGQFVGYMADAYFEKKYNDEMK